MDLQTFERLIQSDRRALRYLRKACRKKGRLVCLRCRTRQVYRLGSGRSRCGRCRYTFGDFTGRWLGQLRMGARQWLWLVKLFEVELSARKMAHQLPLSYPTVLRAVEVIRRSLVAQRPEERWLLQGEVEADEAYFGGRRKGRRGRGARGKIPVFGILERRGRVHVEVVPDVTAETLLASTLRLVRRGSLVYTDRYRSYDTLMFCGYRHLRVDHSRRFARGWARS